MLTYEEMEAAFRAADVTGKFQRWTGAQWNAFRLWDGLPNERLLLFYPTGKGKTKVALAMMRHNGYDRAIVIAPPKTQESWKADARTVGLELVIMSHQKFRMKDTKLPKDVPIIVDEFHMLGKHNGVGFKKLDRMAARFPGIILASATPNYNDADRCYNICHVLDTVNHMGGYPRFVENHCTTVINYFSKAPEPTGFINYGSAADFLADLPYCAYIPDDAQWKDLELKIKVPVTLDVFDEWGYSGRKHRIMASQMEERWHRKRLIMLRPDQRYVRQEVIEPLREYMANTSKKFLVYSRDKEIATAFAESLLLATPYVPFLITGDTNPNNVDSIKQGFINCLVPAVLVCTDAVVTGVDGIDGVCDHLIILHDTDDASLRRQLIGRVLPRGDYQRETYVTTVVTIEQP